MNTTSMRQAGVTPRVSVVVIGRNEGERLSRCLASVAAGHWDGLSFECIYVDSRSSDDSVARARASGASVLLLDDEAPCAAKARNLGWRQALGEFILFLDGDTELHPAFVARALQTLQDPALCAVWGHRRESNPRQSLYTQVLDLDWIYPTGPSLYFGGDVFVRREALAQVGGFDGSLKAGEEPELCARLRKVGWRIEHIDAPMTRHDLAVTTLRAYCRRAYRSGIAYAEVACRARSQGDALWQAESARDLRHGLLWLVAPLLGLAAWAWSTWLAAALLAALLALFARTAVRSAWKAPGQFSLLAAYAVHSHLQKVPALFGQLHWRRAHRLQAEIGLVEYKDSGAGRALTARQRVKGAIVAGLRPVASAWRALVRERWMRLWSAARLGADLAAAPHPSNVVMGVVDVQGTRQVRIGQRALIYPGVCLETQGQGRIDIGDDVVLSRGVHIVAFDHVVLGNGAMVGEYSSLRDADHRRDAVCMRHSGHEAAPIDVGCNVWIGRGVTVLKGVRIGAGSIVAAGAVVTRDVGASSVVAGVPARALHPAATASGHGAVEARVVH